MTGVWRFGRNDGGHPIELDAYRSVIYALRHLVPSMFFSRT